MRWSKAFIPTLRDAPAGAEAPSHRLLTRAGFIRPLHSGHYSLLPLAQKVRLRVIDIIRREMQSIDAQEMFTPTMHPVELWESSGRSSIDVLFRLKDRRKQDLVMGATHEEVFTDLAREIQSHKLLPQSWFQFQTKYRDEPRPKGGLLRVREFTMKDSYSFGATDEDLDRSFEDHRSAYVRIFEALGIPAFGVSASSGVMGGGASVEFMAQSDSGEDNIVRCPQCDYAANLETATSKLEIVANRDGGTVESFDTPGVRTIADLAAFPQGATAEHQIKTLVFMQDGSPLLVLLRGDHELEEQKLVDALDAGELRAATAEEILKAMGANAGSLGAVGVDDKTVIADMSLQGRSGMTTGANQDDVHFRNVDVARDMNVSRWLDLRRVKKGEPCVNCGTPLDIVTAVEVGHIFKLGTKYTKAMNVTVLDGSGNSINPIMGCYGIGVERAMAVVAEIHHDDKGLIWPASVAPFDVIVVPLQPEDAEVAATAEQIYTELSERHEVLIDDRPLRAGVKLADAELIGIPVRVTVGKRKVAEGAVEITDRATGATEDVAVADVAANIDRRCSGVRK